MSQIEELQSRITAAMDRIGAGIETLGTAAGAADAGAEADLAAALEEEKLANAQLGERLKTIKARHEEDLQALRDELDRSDEVAGLKDEIDTLTAATETLKSEAEGLRAEAGRLKAEIEALRSENADLAAQRDKAKANAEAQDGLDRKRAEAINAQADAMARLDMEVQRLRLSNEQLREIGETLRKSNAEGVSDTTLINKAMLAEIEGLRATRAADAAEAGAVLTKLEALLDHASDLPEGEDE